MTTRHSSRFRDFLLLCALECKQKWEQWSIDLHALWQYFFLPQTLAWSPLDEMALAAPEGGSFIEGSTFPSAVPVPNPTQANPHKKWMVAETIDANNNNNVMLVEVEYFPSESVTPRNNTPNHYTAEGEDPNLRITHYPPSNRLH